MQSHILQKTILIMAVIFCASLFLENNAEARRGIIPVVINTGDAIYEVGEMPPILKIFSTSESDGYKLGYRCSHFGLFWMDIACWNKELVLFKGHTYSPIPEGLRKVLAEEHPFSDAKRSFWNEYGFFSIIGLIVLCVVVNGCRKSGTEAWEPKYA